MPTPFLSKADLAYTQIRQQILDGTLPAGSRLAQYDLAAELGISITPLREAIRRLSGEGWVLLDVHRNARVADVDLAEAAQVLEARRVLEPAALALAAARRTDEDVVRLRSALDALLPVTREGGDVALAAHRAVHEALYRASHNSVVAGMLDRLWDRSDRYRRVGLEQPVGQGPRDRDLEEHRRLVELVVAGDGAAAAQLMTSHVDASVTAEAVRGAGVTPT